jgi:hypothetical protein
MYPTLDPDSTEKEVPHNGDRPLDASAAGGDNRGLNLRFRDARLFWVFLVFL